MKSNGLRQIFKNYSYRQRCKSEYPVFGHLNNCIFYGMGNGMLPMGA